MQTVRTTPVNFTNMSERQRRRRRDSSVSDAPPSECSICRYNRASESVPVAALRTRNGDGGDLIQLVQAFFQLSS